MLLFALPFYFSRQQTNYNQVGDGLEHKRLVSAPGCAGTGAHAKLLRARRQDLNIKAHACLN